MSLWRRIAGIISGDNENEAANAKAELAAQIAHDIRSPLAALTMATRDLSGLPEETRIIIRSAINRINDIANDLIHQHVDQATLVGGARELDTDSLTLLPTLIEPLVTEKRLKERARIDVEIETQFGQNSYGAFAAINPLEFRRRLSVLIDEATAIVKTRGQVIVGLEHDGKTATVSVLARDLSGTQRTESLSKMQVPLSPHPKWFVEKLIIAPGMKIVVLDDDTSIHQIWTGRFESQLASKSDISLLHFSTAQALRSWFHENGSPRESVLYLVDYELLGQGETGLDLVEQLGIQDVSILVSSRYEEAHVRFRCEKLGIALIPKGMAVYVPITIGRLSTQYVLIDDDPLVHTAWKFSAKKAGKDLVCFTSLEEFLKNVAAFSPSTVIYVDSNLGSEVKGEVASEEISKRGFSEIYLATGYDSSKFGSIPWLKGVVGKNPPW